MKNYIQLSILIFMIYSCAENSKKETSPELNIQKTSSTKDVKTALSLEDTKESLESLESLGGFLNDDKGQNNDSLKENDLDKLLKMSGADSKEKDDTNSLGNMFKSEAILDLLQASGVSRKEMEKLVNNPDSLEILAQQAIKNRKNAQEKKEKAEEEKVNIEVVEINTNKGKITKEQLENKSTPTGISLEEAILMVQAESGPEATIAKLKKIDSLTGKNTMEQLDLSEAGYVMRKIERKNEVKASPEEVQKMETLKKKSGQLHSEKEAKTLLAKLENTEKKIASGEIKVSPQFQRTIKHQKNSVKIFHKSIVRKSKVAKNKFKKLNPNLYFGEEVGETYLGYMQKAVYLPLGKLSFADKVVTANHPLLMTQQVNNVLNEPDVIKGFLAKDITGIHSLGLGGSLTIQFTDNALTNVNGPDLYIFEIGAIEPTELEISKDGKSWIKVGKIDGGVAEVDIEKFVKQGELFYYVRLTDLKKKSGLPGADLDAIAAIGAAMRLNLDSKVLFDTGKSELKPAGIEAIKALANSIKILKKGNVIVEGHTDDVGSNETNQKLSLARAKSVSAELKKIIPSNQFKWREKGLGETKPIAENDSEINRAKNRRVEILILPN